MRTSSLLLALSLSTSGTAFALQPFSKVVHSSKSIKARQTLLYASSEDAAEPDEAANDDADNAQEILRGGGLPKEIEPLPTMRDYRKFALPCLGLWIAGPLLSLVDTAFVGLSGDASVSAEQIAALGPATTFFDGATYLFAFLNVASTNLYSSARAQYGPNHPKTESVVRTAARVALISGVCITALLLFCARPLLGLYIGAYAVMFLTMLVFMYQC